MIASPFRPDFEGEYGALFLKSRRFGFEPDLFVLLFSADFEVFGCLRKKSDVGAHGDAGIGQRPDNSFAVAFQLNAVGARFNQTAGVGNGGFRRFVTEMRHIGPHKRIRRARADGAGVVNHLTDRYFPR